jgi:AbrB family looped-hinge helix DNA binding protein
MKEFLIPIDKAGRLVLPKQVRSELAISPGDMLKVSIHGNEVMLTPTKEIAGFVKRGKALIFSSGADDLLEGETVEAVLEEVRQERTAEIGPRFSSRKRHQ